VFAGLAAHEPAKRNRKVQLGKHQLYLERDLARSSAQTVITFRGIDSAQNVAGV
jgi:hypothetical protein